MTIWDGGPKRQTPVLHWVPCQRAIYDSALTTGCFCSIVMDQCQLLIVHCLEVNDMAEQKRDYYEVLGVDKGASDDELKRAYRKLAKNIIPI